VLSADWDSARALWTVVTEDEAGARRRTARLLYLGSGYYDYDTAHDAQFAGREDFRADHPSAVLAERSRLRGQARGGDRFGRDGGDDRAVDDAQGRARHHAAAHADVVRDPPARDALANALRRILPEKVAYAITRFKNVRLQDLVFKRARSQPEKVKDYLTKKIKAALGDKYDAKTFTPPYDPWDQRLCLVPDADMFEAIKAGKADIVTDHIDRFDATGISSSPAAISMPT
jgi:cation diffusion facilitator CzcD-associated flavoprotein CzcO